MFCMLLYVFGAIGNVLISEVSLFQKSLIERFHCIHIIFIIYDCILQDCRN